MHEKFRPKWDLNSDLCNAGAVLQWLSYQAIMWVYDKLVDTGLKVNDT